MTGSSDRGTYMETLKRTCLYDSHVALGAQMSPFGGFMMPIQYSDIILEHKAVRQSCGMFDVSHMGEISVSGPDAGKFVDHIFTNDVAGLAPGHIRYGMMLYPEGGVVDDLLVYGMDGRYLLVVNAANTGKDFAWISEAAQGYDVSIGESTNILSYTDFAEKGYYNRLISGNVNHDGYGRLFSGRRSGHAAWAAGIPSVLKSGCRCTGMNSARIFLRSKPVWGFSSGRTSRNSSGKRPWRG